MKNSANNSGRAPKLCTIPKNRWQSSFDTVGAYPMWHRHSRQLWQHCIKCLFNKQTNLVNLSNSWRHFQKILNDETQYLWPFSTRQHTALVLLSVYDKRCSFISTFCIKFQFKRQKRFEKPLQLWKCFTTTSWMIKRNICGFFLTKKCTA